MKILFITSFFGKDYGGAEVSTGLLLHKLNAKGYNINSLTTLKKPDNHDHLITLTGPVTIPKKFITLGNTALDYYLARQIKTQLETIKPDILHVQDTYILPATVIANNDLKIPVVVTIRNSVLDKSMDMMFPFPISEMLKHRNAQIINALTKVTYVITVSDYIKTELIGRGLDTEKIFTIYNLPPENLSEEYQESNKQKIKLIAPGFLVSFKGFQFLIRAMERVIAKCPTTELIIVGDGPERKSLEKLVKKLKLVGSIKFTGRVIAKEMPSLYLSSDIVVFPSLYPEPFGRVALEGMYYGRPVVGCSVGGIPEIIRDRETGFLIQPNNIEMLAKAIITLIENKELRLAMGQKGKNRIQEYFSEEKIVAEHVELYRRAIQSPYKFKR